MKINRNLLNGLKNEIYKYQTLKRERKENFKNQRVLEDRKGAIAQENLLLVR